MRAQQRHPPQRPDRAPQQQNGPTIERTFARVSLNSIRSNYHAIQDLVPGLSILPMIKANAYGHGAVHVARALQSEPGLYGYGVATLEEGRELREELGSSSRRGMRSGRIAPIIVFSGAAPWTEEIGQYCEKFGLTPVIASEENWVRFRREGWPERIRYELEFNTGMNRLGMPVSFAKKILQDLKDHSATEHPAGIFSHLASSDDPECALSRMQMELFIELRRTIGDRFPSTHFHLANSGAIWNAKHWQLKEFTDVVRPGLSLYGVVPWSQAPARGIELAMSVQSHVLQVLNLKPGDKVGYGGDFKVSGKDGSQGARVATVAMGYADGLHRILSGRGHVYVGEQRVPLLGRVSMDLCAIQCPDSVKAGDWVTMLGNPLDPWVQSKEAGTIPYELLTSVSDRVKRIYVD